jgi:hypothetical protein
MKFIFCYLLALLHFELSYLCCLYNIYSVFKCHNLLLILSLKFLIRVQLVLDELYITVHVKNDGVIPTILFEFSLPSA